MSRRKKIFFGSGVFIAALIILFFVCDRISPVQSHVSYSTQIMSSDSVLMHVFLANDDKWRLKTETREINPLITKTLLYKEDKWFRYHPGINPIAMMRALVNNIFHAKRTSGASTITMQVARLLYPAPRTYKNKFIEMFRALQLERHYSKDQILQLYLNLVPYGGNIEGIKSASYIYFQKPPQQLSLSEITALAIIPNRPTSLSKKNTQLLVAERNKWLTRMRNDNLYDKQMIADAMMEPIALSRHRLPTAIPHLASRLKASTNECDIIYSSINRDAQYSVEKIVKNYAAKLSLLDITNAAVLVNDNVTGKIMCYIGSADYNDNINGGQVDGTKAIRSPGSTLKPLVYGMAFDQGLLTPKTVMADVPMNVSGYIPENYDEKHNGAVTTEFALINSLNIPAVKTLNDVGLQTFIEKLNTCGFSSITQKQNGLGLSMVLGGCGVTLEQLVRMYSAIANEGTLQPMLYTMDVRKDTVTKVKIMSSEASYMVTNILSQMTRPDLPYNMQNAINKSKVAWKTGTSYGRRDAWCIGYNKRYTVGVWVGNFSGVGVPELSGAEMATPLMVEIMNTLAYNKNIAWYNPPLKIKVRNVCSVTGDLPGDYCTSTSMDFYIPMVSKNQICTHFHNVAVSNDEKYAYCMHCMPAYNNQVKYKLCDNLTAELQTFYDNNNISYLRQPPHSPTCERVFGDASPLIVSPVNNMEYITQKNDDNQMLLQSQVTADVQKIYWYINNKLYKACSPAERIFFIPTKGTSKITCADDKGRNTTITINVKSLGGNL
ncbi:MAG: penicillin-binding protein 1C [Bacteroidetes bacterium]|nr:penicillin-binding protein 1C [Bacteroidota bacterium]